MFEEYRDRVGELIDGIVQQSDCATRLSSYASASRRCCRSPSRSTASATTTPSASRPSSRRSRPRPRAVDHRLSARPRAHQKLFELEVPEIADGLVEIANVAASPATARRSRSSPTPTAWTRSAPASARGLARAHGRLRAARREDRHHPLQRRAARFVAKALSPARVREVLVDDDAARPPSWSPTTSSRWPSAARARTLAWPRADRLAHRHQVRDRVRHRGPRGRLPGGGDRRALRRDPGQRPPLPERGAARLALLRPRQPPGAGGDRHRLVAGAPPARVGGREGEVEEAVAEEARPRASSRRRGQMASSRRRCRGRRPSRRSRPRRSGRDADALEPAPEAFEPDALAADTEPRSRRPTASRPGRRPRPSRPRRGDGGGARR